MKRMKSFSEHIIIENIQPSTADCGRFALKRIVGEPLKIEATIFRDGHEKIRAELIMKLPRQKLPFHAYLKLENAGLDLWSTEITLDKLGEYAFDIYAWTDVFGSWWADFKKRIQGGQADISGETQEGLKLLNVAAGHAKQKIEKERIALAQQILDAKDLDKNRIYAEFDREEFGLFIDRLIPRFDEVHLPQERTILVEPEIAQYGSWYEFFVRSQGKVPGVAATFHEAEERLLDVAQMGFNVLYLPPIHPIGTTKRKGKNNALVAADGDPGSPWAIGNSSGGHTEIEPSLGTMKDFEHFVKRAEELGIAIALDFAIQASPDHPWVKEHPEWFYHRADGSIKCAENPPKKYEDVYPLNFDSADAKELWNEMKRVVLFWAKKGVRIFRVDNPHTKPIPFWEWLISEVKKTYPETIFLAEAFTRPPMMKQLGKIGFSQSYTYFTWRNTKAELMEYLTELAQTEMREYYRPNFFVNTPDILPTFLQNAPRSAFLIRATLGATLSPTWGVYSGFELCENDPIPGKEEYNNSEKYEVKVRDWNSFGNIKDWIRMLNTARQENKAFQHLWPLKFLKTDRDDILAYVKTSPDKNSAVIVVVNLDPHNTHHATLWVEPEEWGLAPDATFQVKDYASSETYTWKRANYVELHPERPAHILRVEK